jgi:hypothetical protein
MLFLSRPWPCVLQPLQLPGESFRPVSLYLIWTPLPFQATLAAFVNRPLSTPLHRTLLVYFISIFPRHGPRFKIPQGFHPFELASRRSHCNQLTPHH